MKFRIDVHHHFDAGLPPVSANLILAAIQKLETIMSAALDRLTTEVAETRTANASLITLVQGLAQLIRDNANDPAKLNALADDLDAGQAEVAAAVTANTPPTPEPVA